MAVKKSTSRLLIFVATILFVLAGTILMIRYAQGYRPTTGGLIKGTGLLSANSYPTAAEVYVDGRLTTATDNTLNLDPGDYQVEIKKDGYHTWGKQLRITEELVTETNTQLFPTSPALEPLTYTGAENVIPSPGGSSIAFTVASSSASTKNGLYVQDLSSSPIALNRSARQIARTGDGYDYTTASYTWGPSGSELLVAFENGSHIVLDTSRFNDAAEFIDVTVKLGTLLSDWEVELARLELTRLTELPPFFQELATASGMITNLYFAPDGEKLLYQSLSELTIPEGLLPALPSSSTQTQVRTTKPGNWYVYDLKEDRNFEIAQSIAPSPSPILKPKTTTGKLENGNTETRNNIFTPSKLMLLSNLDPIKAELVSSPSAFRLLQTGGSVKNSLSLFNAQYSPIFVSNIQWYPSSRHLILTSETGIDIIEYDGTNRATIYGGPMDTSIVYPWPDGSKIVTKIQFSPDTIPNLYTIKLK